MIKTILLTMAVILVFGATCNKDKSMQNVTGTKISPWMQKNVPAFEAYRECANHNTMGSGKEGPKDSGHQLACTPLLTLAVFNLKWAICCKKDENGNCLDITEKLGFIDIVDTKCYDAMAGAQFLRN